MKETKEQKELKKKVIDFLTDEWDHNVPLDRLKDEQHILRVIKWIQDNDTDNE